MLVMSQSYFPSEVSSQNGVHSNRRSRAYGLDAKIVVLGNSGLCSPSSTGHSLTALLGVGKTSLLQVSRGLSLASVN